MVKGNKGEWSEPYVVIRLLGEGRLYLADADGNKNDNEWMQILDVLRYETCSHLVKYHYDPKETVVTVYIENQMVVKILADEFLKYADMLRGEIVSGKGASFSVSDEIMDFFKRVKIDKNHLKAESINKSDIFLNLVDPRAAIVRNNIGFSIKSKFGQNPTLFNTAQACAPIFQLDGMTDELMDEVNSLFDAKGHAAVRDRCALILQHCKVSFVGYPVAKKAGCEAFAENLELLNRDLKIVIPHMLYNYFFLGFSEVDLNKVVERVIQDNPAGISRPEFKYPYMIKNFLYAAYCGMTASTLWDGKSNVNGGFITVCNNGDVLAHYALESDAFKTYLYNNCYLEFPSTSPKHGNYGIVYKEGSRYYFRLNFQIRYK